MKILLDVGANTGQTAEAALHPKYRFDKIVCFEPAEPCWPAIQSIGDPRIELCKFGLSNKSGRAALFNPGHLGASIYRDMPSVGRSPETATIQLFRASDWTRDHLRPGDVVFMKLNCEGSECDIVEDLLESRELERIYSVMICFDVRQSRSLSSREVPLRKRLRRCGATNVCSSDDVMLAFNSHCEGVQHWLDIMGAHEDSSLEELRKRYAPRLADYGNRSGTIARLEWRLRTSVYALLPPVLKDVTRKIWWRVVRRVRESPRPER